jgi:hypothetical protein
MQNITSLAELTVAIQMLEEERSVKEKLFKEQLFITYESFKPISLLKSTINELTSSPYLLESILSTVLGVSSGFLTKRVVTGLSGGIIRKILGSVLQFGVTKTIAQHSGSIRSIGQFIFQKFLHKKEKKPDKE